jgi:lysophospholipase L1-like esterase
MTQHILVYGDSLSWGIVPGTRERLAFDDRWPQIMERQLSRAGHQVRVIEDCLNGRRTVWDDPFKPGRNGIVGIEQRIEVNSPLALVIVMLGINDLQSVHQHNAWHASQGVAAIVRAIRRAPIEPGMSVPPVLIVAPPPAATARGDMAPKFADAAKRSAGLAHALQQVAAELVCAFFDAGRVIRTSDIDGVHLDTSQHAVLGRELAPVVTTLVARAPLGAGV